MQILKTSHYTLTVGGASALLTYATPTASRGLMGPTFEVDGAPPAPRLFLGGEGL